MTKSSLKLVGITAVIVGVFAGGYAYRGASQISEANAATVPSVANTSQNKTAIRI